MRELSNVKNCTTCKYAIPCNLFEPVAMCMKQNDAVVSFPTGDNPPPCELWEDIEEKL